MKSLQEIKDRARKEAHIRRKAATDPTAATRATRIFFDNIDVKQQDVVALYRAIQTELDPLPIAEALWDKGISTCLPVIVVPNTPLIFKNYDASTQFVSGGFGTEIPDDAEPELIPTLVLAPLLTFDRRIYRLGYGGGFYDRTLEKLRSRGKTRAYGYAYAAQETDEVPVESTDQRLDGVITENGLIRPIADPSADG